MAEKTAQLTVTPLRGIPMVRQGDDLATIVGRSISSSNVALEDGDIVVVAQKIVSKAEGRLVRLDDVEPTADAVRLAEKTDKDPRLVELILRESTDVVRAVPGVLIVRHRLGIVSANAGIDQSNIDHADGDCVLLLPKNPDASARRLRADLVANTTRQLGVIISDSVNRPWRLGSVGIAIGCAGALALDDRRGTNDLYGRQLKITMTNRADSVATAALLVMGETSEGVPAAIVSGLDPGDTSQDAADCIRPIEDDLFL